MEIRELIQDGNQYQYREIRLLRLFMEEDYITTTDQAGLSSNLREMLIKIGSQYQYREIRLLPGNSQRLHTHGTYGVVLYKNSLSDVGFTSGRPYSSGSTIQFTIEETDALEPGTYYWKVRGYNSDLSWMHGDWTETRTLTITLASVNFSGISITGVNIN
ncbi:MAG: hypothetical protein KatS3mg087_1502 [Patescibacteria group bacterium]|nr:MAG: hypothetical protein KatS3mg087_1502 [Patescibacteria group bacterium]